MYPRFVSTFALMWTDISQPENVKTFCCHSISGSNFWSLQFFRNVQPPLYKTHKVVIRDKSLPGMYGKPQCGPSIAASTSVPRNTTRGTGT